VIVLGVIAPQVRPDGTVSVSVVVPVKPLIPVTVIVDVADCPTLTAAGELAAIVKSVSVNVAVAVCVIAGLVLVPVMVTTNVPAVVELQANVAV
jgi:hypothetical protein